jgi:hypothetical protein
VRVAFCGILEDGLNYPGYHDPDVPGLAIFNHPERHKPWHVLHTPSGLWLGFFRLKMEAEECLRRLSDLGDWDKPPSQVDYAMTRASSRLVASFANQCDNGWADAVKARKKKEKELAQAA